MAAVEALPMRAQSRMRNAHEQDKSIYKTHQACAQRPWAGDAQGWAAHRTANQGARDWHRVNCTDQCAWCSEMAMLWLADTAQGGWNAQPIRLRRGETWEQPF